MSYQKIKGAMASAKKGRFTASGAVSDGAVVVDGDRVGVAFNGTADTEEGLFVVETDEHGILMPKTTGAKTRNTKAYWDADGDPVGGTAGSGAAVEVPGEDIKTAVIAGGSAGAHTVTGIATEDTLLAVHRVDLDGTAANIDYDDLTSEFSISAANTIDNTGGTDTTGDKLAVIYRDKSGKNKFLGFFAATAASGDAEVPVHLVSA